MKEYVVYSIKEFEDIEDALSDLTEDIGFIVSLMSYIDTTPYQDEIINLVSNNVDSCEKELYNSRYSKTKEEFTIHVGFFYTKLTTLIINGLLLLGTYNLLVSHIMENELTLEMMKREKDRIRADGTG